MNFTFSLAARRPYGLFAGELARHVFDADDHVGFAGNRDAVASQPDFRPMVSTTK